ncbi:MFS transporter [Loigolactobacillus zhaoyuanensis]|uniref:MFS transporter n=1 Tax=Loigolactobacillus zhaoyuanensis TaxID=2486017 RepID=UPI000F7450D8|nr:MFS transporter [Loigolactobacillus zhaoyuanensis]
MEGHKGFTFKAALLGISLLLYSAGAVATAIPLMLQDFTNVSRTMVEMLITVPSVVVLIFVFFSNLLVRWLGDKATIIIGLIVVIISGMLPFFTDNFTLIIISRMLLGAGIGLFNSLSYSIIGKFFADAELAKMMGFQTAIGSFGNFLMVMIVSGLLGFGWHAAYLVYLLAVPILLLFWWKIPSRKNEQPYLVKAAPVVDSEEKTQEKPHLNALILAFLAIIFIYYFAWPTPPLNMGSVILGRGYANLQEATIAISLLSLASMFGGVMFSTHYRLLGRLVLPLGMAIGGGAFIGMVSSTNLIVTIIFAMIAGYTAGGSNPYIFLRVNESAQNNATAVLGQSLLVIGANVAYFLLPVFWGAVNSVQHASEIQIPRTVIFGAGLIMLTLAAIIFLSMVFSKKRQPGSDSTTK